LVNILRDYDLDEGPNISQHNALLLIGPKFPGLPFFFKRTFMKERMKNL
jgi:hypothetical protein